MSLNIGMRLFSNYSTEPDHRLGKATATILFDYGLLLQCTQCSETKTKTALPFLLLLSPGLFWFFLFRRPTRNKVFPFDAPCHLPRGLVIS